MYWALLDQGVVSATRFFFSVFLARYFGSDGFGVYTIIWTVVLFYASIHVTLISTSALHFLSKSTKEIPKYKKSLSKYNAFFFAFYGLSFFILMAYKGEDVYYYLSVLVFGLAYMQYELKRREKIATEGYRITFNFDLVMITPYFISMTFIYFFGLELPTGLLIITICQLIVLLSDLKAVNLTQNFTTTEYDRDIWRYSKDSMILTVFQYIAGHLFIFVVAYLMTSQDVANIGVAKALLGPFIVLFIVCENYLTPKIASCSTDFSVLNNNFKRDAVVVTSVVTIGISPFLFFPEFIVGLIYGSDYAEAASLIVLLALSFTFMALTRVCLIYMRAIVLGKYIRQGSFIVLFTTLIITYPLIANFGLTGAGVTIIIQQLLLTCFFWKAVTSKLHNLSSG